MYQYYLFDLDGTLTDSGPGIMNSVEYALRKYGIENPDRGLLRKFIGPPLSWSFETYFGFSEEKALEAVAYYREYFSVTGLFENSVYDGIPEVLAELKKRGIHLAVATSKPEAFTLRILEHFDLMKYFEFVGAASMDESRNKKDQVIAYTLESLNLTDEEQKAKVLMIGDREHDILGARANGLASAGVLFGYGSLDELRSAGADYIAQKPQDILDFQR